MYLDINKYILIFIGWLIQDSYQLDCVQCTTPIRRTRNWDHSCLDGTLLAIPCPKTVNESDFVQCTSDLFRIGGQGLIGVLLDRRCISIPVVQHECDPLESYKNFDKKSNFFCRRTCEDDGCNRHSYKDVLANANQLTKSILLYFICIIFLFYFEFNLFS